jgi:hypothetical protein
MGDNASYVKRLFIPGLRALGGLLTPLVLAAPAPTFIHNADGGFPCHDIARLYDALGCPAALTVEEGEAAPGAIVEWLSGAAG